MLRRKDRHTNLIGLLFNYEFRIYLQTDINYRPWLFFNVIIMWRPSRDFLLLCLKNWSHISSWEQISNIRVSTKSNLRIGTQFITSEALSVFGLSEKKITLHSLKYYFRNYSLFIGVSTFHRLKIIASPTSRL